MALRTRWGPSVSLRSPRPLTRQAARPLPAEWRTTRIAVRMEATKQEEAPSTRPREEEEEEAAGIQRASLSSSELGERAPRLLASAKERWEAMHLQQQASLVALGLVAAVALPKVLTLAVLGVERILIGGLLVAEEALLELFYRGGILLGAAAAVGVSLYAFYAFAGPKGGGSGGSGKS